MNNLVWRIKNHLVIIMIIMILYWWQWFIFNRFTKIRKYPYETYLLPIDFCFYISLQWRPHSSDLYFIKKVSFISISHLDLSSCPKSLIGQWSNFFRSFGLQCAAHVTVHGLWREREAGKLHAWCISLHCQSLTKSSVVTPRRRKTAKRGKGSSLTVRPPVLL